ncbi:MAG: hypothetical protein U0736_23635 [Gemmataceae bacterium]
MSQLTLADAVGQVVAVLDEAFSPPQRSWSYFLDRQHGGLLQMMAGLTAEEASQPVGGSSVAAHAHHVAFALAASKAWLEGRPAPRDWEASWVVHTVDADAWEALQVQVRANYLHVREAIGRHAADRAEAFGGAVGAAAHAAYHVGAIRQKLAVLRAG